MLLEINSQKTNLLKPSSTGGTGFFDNSAHKAGVDAANAAGAAANHNMHYSPPPASF